MNSNCSIMQLIDQHGFQSVAQAFLRLLELNDEFEISSRVWKVTKAKSGSKTIVSDNIKPVTFSEKPQSFLISAELADPLDSRGYKQGEIRKVFSQPVDTWSSRRHGNSKRAPYYINVLLRDIEGELVRWIHTVPQFRQETGIIRVIRRAIPTPALVGPEPTIRTHVYGEQLVLFT